MDNRLVILKEKLSLHPKFIAVRKNPKINGISFTYKGDRYHITRVQNNLHLMGRGIKPSEDKPLTKIDLLSAKTHLTVEHLITTIENRRLELDDYYNKNQEE